MLYDCQEFPDRLSVDVMNQWVKKTKEGIDPSKKDSEWSPRSIYKVFRFALRVIGLSYDDFCRLTLEEFYHINRAWEEHRQGLMKDEWERMRLLATMTIQPHTKKKLNPQSLLPLPWDKKERKDSAISREESEKRFEKLIARTNGKV